MMGWWSLNFKPKKLAIQYGLLSQWKDKFKGLLQLQIHEESTFKTTNHALKQALGLYDKMELSDYLGARKPCDADESLFYKADNSSY